MLIFNSEIFHQIQIVMKDFLKFTFATVTGIILSGSILFLIGIITIVGLVSSTETETSVKDNSIFFLDLSGNLIERSEDNPFTQFLGDDFNTYGLDDILTSIKKAKKIDEIKGIYLQSSFLNSAFASLEEIRNALIDFKESGKFIIAYADNYTQGLYYLSSVADKVMLNPQGIIEWKGLASQPIFYKDLLQKLGIEMQVFKVGTYKSAVEPYISTEMSPANREQVTEFINSIWNRVLNDVSQSRNISIDSLNTYANRMMMFYPAKDFVTCGLIDTLVYKDGIRNYLKQQLKLEKDDDIRTLTLSEMINVKKDIPKDKSGNIVAIYYAYGEIDGMDDTNGINSQKVIKDLRKLRENENVKAVVLRVNSPGGSAFGSEQIWHEVSLLKAIKPVIVSMGDYAASGGYYISCAADTIVAQPTTLTGSIGIFGMIPNVEGLTNKIGLNFDVVKTNMYSDFGALGRGLNNDEKALMQMYINNGYNLFVKRCADGRNMTMEAIEKIAEGRVWTGAEAQKIGLIDELGGMDKAIEIAAKKADIESYTLLEYPEKEGFFSTFLNKKASNYIESKLRNCFGDYYMGFNFMKKADKQDLIQARMPFDLNIK